MRFESELKDLFEKGDFDNLVKRLSEIGEKEHLNLFAMQNLYSFCKDIIDKLNGYHKAKALMCLGNICFILRKLDESERYYDESLSIFFDLAKKDSRYLHDIVSVLINKGNLSYNLRKFDDAEKHYANALDVLRDIGSEEEIATVLHNLGVLFLTTKRYREARKVLSEAVEIREKLAEKDERYINDLIESLNNYGILLKSEKKFDEAEKIFEKVLILKNDPGVLLNIASIKLEKGEFDEAKRVVDEILGQQNLPHYIKAKALIAKAFANEKIGKIDEAGKDYLLAASISYLITRQYRLSNLNFVIWLEKAMHLGDYETREVAKAMLTGLERLYYNIDPDTRDLSEDVFLSGIIKKAIVEKEFQEFAPKDEVESAAYLIAKDVIEFYESIKDGK